VYGQLSVSDFRMIVIDKQMHVHPGGTRIDRHWWQSCGRRGKDRPECNA